MKFKTLIDKKSNEFIVIELFGGKNKVELFTSSVPRLLPMTATKEGIIKYYNNDTLLEGVDLIEVEVKLEQLNYE